MLRYRTDAVSFGDFATEYGYNDLNDDNDNDKALKKELEDHYLAFNVPTIATGTGEKSSILRSQAKASITQYNTTLREQRIASLPPEQRARESLPEQPLQFDPDRDGTITTYGKAFTQGVGTGLTEAVSGVGILSNTVARLFDESSDFGLDTVELGQNLTEGFKQFVNLDPDQENFGTEVAQGLGQFITLLIPGTAGARVGSATGKVLTKAGLANTGRITSTIGATTGALTSASAQQASSALDRYIADQPEGAQFDQETVNELVAGSIGIALVDSIAPTRILGNRAIVNRLFDKVVSNRRLRTASSRLGNATETAIIEGATEGFQSILEDISAELSISDEDLETAIDNAFDQISADTTGRQASVGAATGFGIGLLSALLPGRSRAPTTTPNDPSSEQLAAPTDGPLQPGDVTGGQQVDPNYEFNGNQYTVLQDTLNEDGTQGVLRAEVTREDGSTQIFTADPSRPNAAPLIQDYIGQRNERGNGVQDSPLDEQGQVFNYEADPIEPDQSTATPDNTTVNPPVSPVDTDGQSASAELKRLRDKAASLSQQKKAPFKSIRRKITQLLASGGELKNSEDQSSFIRGTYRSPDQKGILRLLETYSAGLRGSDLLTLEPVYAFKKALISHYGNTITDSQISELNQAFVNGDGVAFSKLPSGLRDTISPMKDLVNSQSAQISVELESIITKVTDRFSRMSDKLGPDHKTVLALGKSLSQYKQQLKAVTSNLPSENNPLGSYTHTSYEAIHNSELRKRNFDPASDLYQNLVSTFSSIILKREGTTVSPQQAVDQAIADVEAVKRIVEGNKNSFNSTVDKPLLNNINALQKRKRLPPALKKFLGEVTDVTVNFTATIQQQRTILVGIELANNLETIGTGQGWLSESPNSELGITTAFVAGNNNPGVNFLNGLYAPEHIIDGITDFFSIPNQHDQLKYLQSFLSQVKIGKTVLSTAGQVRNLLSAYPIMAVNGALLNGQSQADAARIIVEQLKGRSASAFLQQLNRYGIVRDGVKAGAIIDIVNDVGYIDSTGWLTGEVSGTKRLVEGDGVFKKLTRGAFKAYQVSDDYPKIVIFENYKTILAQAYNPGLTDPSAIEAARNNPRVLEEAAERTRDLAPTYSKVNNLVKSARSLPFTPPFVSFPAEIYRNSKNFIKWNARDLRSGNPVLIKHAGYRTISAAATVGVMYNIGSILAQTVFSESEEEQLALEYMDELSKNQKFTSGNDIQSLFRNDDGSFEQVNFSRYNPYASITDVMGDIISGNITDDVLWNSVKRVTSPFIQVDVTASAINKAIEAHDRTIGSDYDKGLVLLTTLGTEIAPSVYSDSLKAWKAYNGDLYHRDGSRIPFSRTARRLVGISTDRVDPLFLVSEKTRQLDEAIKGLKTNYSFDLSNNKSQSLNTSKYLNAYTEISKLWGATIRDILILEKMGYDSGNSRQGGQVYRALTKSSKTGVGYLASQYSKLLVDRIPPPSLEELLKLPSTSITNKENRIRFYSGEGAVNQSRELLGQKLKAFKE